MKIDINPVIEKANDIDYICLEMRGIDALYVVRLANGDNYSTKWDDKELAEFCPNRSVSEMLISWEETIKRRYTEAVKAYETGIHPTWKRNSKVLHPITQIWTGKYMEVDYLMTKSECEGWKREAEKLTKEFGKLSLVKICKIEDNQLYLAL